MSTSTVVLGLVFLKYMSDRFEARREELEARARPPTASSPSRSSDFIEDRDEYTKHNVFWVPSSRTVVRHPGERQTARSRRDHRQRDGPDREGEPQTPGRPSLATTAAKALDKGRLGQLVDLIGSIGFTETDDHGSDDVLGRVYEYFLGQFAGKETGKDAGCLLHPSLGRQDAR